MTKYGEKNWAKGKAEALTKLLREANFPLYGAPGKGKSVFIKKKYGRRKGFVDVKLSKYAKADVMGIPTFETPKSWQFAFPARACTDDRGWQRSQIIAEHTEKVARDMEAEVQRQKEERAALDAKLEAPTKLGESIENVCVRMSDDDAARVWQLWLKQHPELFATQAFMRFVTTNKSIFMP